MIKTLSYISKINKNQKEINSITQELMKNLKITFNENESMIKYEEYYFNGLPSPKDINIKEINTTSFKLSWKIDDTYFINVDKNKILFDIEIRKVNFNKNFKQIYEGINTNFLVNNLEKKSNYEFRICTNYKGNKSNWSEIKKVKTKSVDSKILNEAERGDEFLEKLYEWSGYKNMELLYRGTRDGTASNTP